MKNELRKTTGITLIALVITIIVLLILAAVSIATLTGENGILTQANKAKEETRGASVQESRDLWKINQQTDKRAGNTTAQSLDELLNELKKQNLLTAEEVSKIKETGSITIGSRTITFGFTLVDMFEKAEADGCTNADGTCTNEQHLHIGDYVNYANPTSGSYTSPATQTGMDKANFGGITDQTFEITTSKNQLNWRVLGKDSSTGGIKLIAGSPMKSNNSINGKDAPYLFMYGAKSYLNAITELNKICKLYSTSLGEARSVTQNDINEITGVTTVDKIKEVNLGYYYGNKQYGDAYSFENQYTPESWLNEKQRTTVDGIVDGYYYSVNSKVNENAPSVTLENNRAYEVLFNNTDVPSGAHFWLASRGVLANSGGANFGPGMLGTDGGVSSSGTCYLFYSYGYEGSLWAGVRPVVSLKSEITKNDIQKINDKVEDIWNYNIEVDG